MLTTSLSTATRVMHIPLAAKLFSTPKEEKGKLQIPLPMLLNLSHNIGGGGGVLALDF